MDNLQVNIIGKIGITDDGVFIKVEPKYISALQGLDGFSHLDVIWWFSDFDNEQAREIFEVPKPYKTSPDIMGIFATRAPVRPNPLALTVVQVLHIDYDNGVIHIAGIDANNDTPVLDIKPYIPSCDRVETPCVPTWCNHWPISVEKDMGFDWNKEFNF